MLAFQVEMLRRVWNVPPTHIDREWTTRNVLNELHLPGSACQVIRQETSAKMHQEGSPAEDPKKQIQYSLKRRYWYD